MGHAYSKDSNVLYRSEYTHLMNNEAPPPYTEVTEEQRVAVGRLGEIISNEATPCMYCMRPILPGELKGICKDCTDKVALATKIQQEDGIPFTQALKIVLADTTHVDHEEEDYEYVETEEERKRRHAKKREALKAEHGEEGYEELKKRKKEKRKQRNPAA